MLGADGEKYACEACIRGHRVSNCNHSDRELKHIAKKGRPVTQCTHCRSLRKSRSTHVKCDCGEKHHGPKEKCCHLKAQEGHSNLPPLERQSSDEHCCHCHFGERCTCALKKDPADLPTLAEDEPMAPTPPRTAARPKLFGAHTDNHLMVITNGHHKPPHRHNNAAHECGMPYKIPPHHSHGMHHIGHRSSDSLPLNLGSDRGSMSTTPDLSNVTDAFFASPTEASPSHIPPTSAPTGGSFDDFANLQSDSSNFGSYGVSQSLAMEAFPEAWTSSAAQGSDVDLPIVSAGSDVPQTYWSGNDLPLVPTVTNASQPPSWTTESNGLFPQPALTAASSSGPQSEIDDALPVNMDDFAGPLTMASNNATTENLLPSTSSYVADDAFPSFDTSIGLESEDKSNNRWSMPVNNFNFDAVSQSFSNSRPTHFRSGSNPVPQVRPASIHALEQYDYKPTPTSNPGSQTTFTNNNWLAQLGLDIPTNSFNGTSSDNLFDLNVTGGMDPQIGKTELDDTFDSTQMTFSSSAEDFGNGMVTDNNNNNMNNTSSNDNNTFSFDGTLNADGTFSNDGWVS